MGCPQELLSTPALSPIGAVGASSKARGSWPFPNICTSIIPFSGEVTSWGKWLRPAKLMAHGALQDHSPCCPLTLHSPTTWLRGHRRVCWDMRWFCQPSMAPARSHPCPLHAPSPALHCQDPAQGRVCPLAVSSRSSGGTGPAGSMAPHPSPHGKSGDFQALGKNRNWQRVTAAGHTPKWSRSVAKLVGSGPQNSHLCPHFLILHVSE